MQLLHPLSRGTKNEAGADTVLDDEKQPERRPVERSSEKYPT